MRLKVGKRLWLVASLILAVLLLASCAGHPRGMKSLRWLTDAEKERVIEIALNTPEALQAREAYGPYTTSLGWVAVNWRNGSDHFGLDYEYEQLDQWIAEHVPESAEYYSQVIIDFGEPPQSELRVAVNPDTGKVAYVGQYGLKKPPAAP
ncbi:hypothetical protein ACFLVH_02595 [Chloroflexota bacterium]